MSAVCCLALSDVDRSLFPVDSFLNEYYAQVEVILIRIVARCHDEVETQWPR